MTIKELINNNIDVNACDIWLEVLNSRDDEIVYSGNALEYPYTEDVNIWDYSMYNLEYRGCKVCIDIWADFPQWKHDQNIYNEENDIVYGEAEIFFFYTWEEPEMF